jgi:hypothetical protein
MSETKGGPNGEIIGIDGPEHTVASRARQWWAATEGIRLIALCVLVMLVGVVLMATISAR